MKKIKTRFAPSPTGVLHIGGARAALFNYLYTQNVGGNMVLRIEDTDKERSKREYEDSIINSLDWLGISWDEFYRQSERGVVYEEYIDRLIASDQAYISKEESGESKEVIRFRNPGRDITFKDEIRDHVTFNTEELGDFVIAKSRAHPLYHLAVVIDDYTMEITHIIRGEDHISNTARQILIQEAIGAPRPVYAHMPLILATDRSKMSKRHGATGTDEYKRLGFEPEAINNFLALLGWHPGIAAEDKEIFSMDELIKLFTLDKIQKGGAVFSAEKLLWFNKSWLDSFSKEEKIKRLEEFVMSDETTASDSHILAVLEHLKTNKVFFDVVFERAATKKEITDAVVSGEYNYLGGSVTYKPEDLIWKKTDLEHTITHLEKLSALLSEVNDPESARAVIWPYAEEVGKGDVLWPLRFALSGKDRSPDPFALMAIIGIDKSKERVNQALEQLKSI